MQPLPYWPTQFRVCRTRGQWRRNDHEGMANDEIPEPTDTEIGAALRPLFGLTRERARMAEIAERLRYATDPDKLGERDRAGNRMAVLDRQICVMSRDALDRIGLWHAAGMIDAALEAAEQEAQHPGPTVPGSD